MIRKNLRIKIFCFLISFFNLLIASESSPLYPMNTWVDINAYFTVGKAMFQGMVPYKDLFDQKGPIIYFIYGLASLISKRSFIGVFLFEIIFFSSFLYYSYKIIELVSNKKYSYVILPTLACLVCISNSFSHGCSVEEFCLPFFSFTIYSLIKFIKEKSISRKKTIILGIISGVIFLIKYTLIAPLFALGVIGLIIYIKQKEYKKAIVFSFDFFLGISIVVVPWIIYFILVDGLNEFIDVYFLINIFSYGNFKINITSIFFLLPKVLKKMLLDDGFYVFIFILSISYLYVLLRKITNSLIIVIFFSLTIILLFIGYNGIFYQYYFLVLYSFLVFGLIYICEVSYNILHFGKICNFIYSLFLIFLLFICANTVSLIGTPKSKLPQYKFAKIIGKKKDATILNYGWLDMGFYFAANKLPKTKYFARLNFFYDDFSEIYDEQKKYIDNKMVDFVIVIETDFSAPSIKKFKKRYNWMYDNYSLIKMDYINYEDLKISFYLLEKIGRE